MPLRIIVADKDHTTASVLSGFFDPALVQLAPVESAADLKKAIKTQTPTLIILDPLLPDMPNWQAAEKIVTAVKRSKEYKSIPVIVLGGDPGGPDSAQLQSLDADAYLNKPLEERPTVSTIESFLKSSHPAAEDDEDDVVIDFGDDDSDYSGAAPVPPKEEATPPGEVLAALEAVDKPNTIQDLPVSEDERQLEVVRQSNGAYDLRLDPGDTYKPSEFIDSLETSLLDYDTQDQERSTDINEIQQDSGQSLLEFFEHEDEPPEGSQRRGDEEPPKCASDKVSEEAPLTETLLRDSEPMLHYDPEQLRSELTRILPDKNEVLEQVRQAISGAFPTRSEVLQRLDMHIEAIIPLKREVLAAVSSRKQGAENDAEDELTFSDVPLSSDSRDKLADAGSEEFPLGDHGQPSVPGGSEEAALRLKKNPLTIAPRVRDILKERIEEMLPEPNQLLSWFREEIDRIVLDTAEEIIRQKIEEITSNSAQ